MALEMKAACQRCGTALGAGDEAYICSREGTYCPACTDGLAFRCPGCDGELVRRPRRRPPKD